MEPIAYDPDIEMKKQIFSIILFLERMRTAFESFDPSLQKRFDVERIDAAAEELKTVVSHVMKTGQYLVPPDPSRGE